MDGSPPDGNSEPSSFIRLIAAVIAFMVIVALSMVYADKKSVMANWKTERCKLPIMLTSFLYKPSDYSGSTSDFAQENFNFCMKSFASSAIKKAAEPALKATSGQIDAQGTVGQLQKSIRQMIANVTGNFSDQLKGIYNRYKIGRGQAIRIFQYLRSATSRLEGVIGAFMYTGLSAFVSVINTVEFIVWVVIGIIIALTIIFILLFFYLFPFTPLILAVITSLVAAGLGTLIGGASSVFCFADNTMVILKDGSLKSIKELKIGDILLDDGVVEGMFVFDGSDTPLYDYKGVLVSGTHLVYCPRTKKYMEVERNSLAKLTTVKVDKVYCPIVSSRHIPVQNGTGGLSLFCDWEEVSTPASEAAWMKKVAEVLHSDVTTYASEYAGFNADTVKVMNEDRKLISIKDVTIGSYVHNGLDLVKVLGSVKRKGKYVPGISDGVWVGEHGLKSWKQFFHPAPESDEVIDLYHLITDSGTFTIFYDGAAYIVRDATEVGINKIRSLTPIVLDELNK